MAGSSDSPLFLFLFFLSTSLRNDTRDSGSIVEYIVSIENLVLRPFSIHLTIGLHFVVYKYISSDLFQKGLLEPWERPSKAFALLSSWSWPSLDKHMHSELAISRRCLALRARIGVMAISKTLF